MVLEYEKQVIKKPNSDSNHYTACGISFCSAKFANDVCC